MGRGVILSNKTDDLALQRSEITRRKPTRKQEQRMREAGISSSLDTPKGIQH